jgi:hypothetical protein
MVCGEVSDGSKAPYSYNGMSVFVNLFTWVRNGVDVKVFKWIRVFVKSEKVDAGVKSKWFVM